MEWHRSPRSEMSVPRSRAAASSRGESKAVTCDRYPICRCIAAHLDGRVPGLLGICTHSNRHLRKKFTHWARAVLPSLAKRDTRSGASFASCSRSQHKNLVAVPSIFSGLRPRDYSTAVPFPPPLALAKRFSPSGWGRIFPLFSRVMREGLSTGSGTRWAGSGLYRAIFSGPDDCARLVNFL